MAEKLTAWPNIELKTLDNSLDSLLRTNDTVQNLEAVDEVCGR